VTAAVPAMTSWGIAKQIETILAVVTHPRKPCQIQLLSLFWAFCNKTWPRKKYIALEKLFSLRDICKFKFLSNSKIAFSTVMNI
jgi:hypothetical protein